MSPLVSFGFCQGLLSGLNLFWESMMILSCTLLLGDRAAVTQGRTTGWMRERMVLWISESHFLALHDPLIRARFPPRQIIS